MIKNKCQGCTNRHVGCHAECNSYLAFKNDIDAARQVKDDLLIIRNYEFARNQKDQKLASWYS